jgi:hypothetical protein
MERDDRNARRLGLIRKRPALPHAVDARLVPGGLLRTREVDRQPLQSADFEIRYELYDAHSVGSGSSTSIA